MTKKDREERERRARFVENEIANRLHDPAYQKALRKRVAVLTKREWRIVQAFRLAVRDVCGQELWPIFEKHFGTIEDSELGEFAVVRREKVRMLRLGEITLDLLVSLLTESEVEDGESRLTYGDLPMPSVTERVIAGYQGGVYWQLTGDSLPPDRKEETIDKIAAYCLLTLCGDQTYMEYRLAGQVALSDEQWNTLADNVRPAVMKALELDDRAAQRINGPYLKSMSDEWMERVTECRAAVPYRWEGEE